MTQYLPYRTPKAYTVTVAGDSAFDGPNVQTFTVNGQQYFAHFLELVNLSQTTAVQVRLNDDPGCTFTLHPNDGSGEVYARIYNPDDCEVFQVDFASVGSGAGAVTVEIQAGLYRAYTG